jgi:hypothetical protein
MQANVGVDRRAGGARRSGGALVRPRRTTCYGAGLPFLERRGSALVDELLIRTHALLLLLQEFGLHRLVSPRMRFVHATHDEATELLEIKITWVTTVRGDEVCISGAELVCLLL